MIEFLCLDCAGRVFSHYAFSGPERLCATCFWVRENIPPKEQAEVRDRLGVPLKTGGNQ